LKTNRLLATTLSLLIVGTTIPAYADIGVAEPDVVGIQVLEGSLSNSFTKTLTGGGHVVDGVGLTVVAADTFDITLPAGASVDMALLYWDVMDAQADVVEFESTDVIPGATTFGTVTDPCWFNTSTTSYRADVTSLVPGTGMYDVTISKAADQNSVLGAALVVIYKDDSASTVTTVLVDDGHIVRTNFEIMSHTMTGFSVSDVPISATTSFIVGDSQAAGISDETFETNIVGDASAPNGPRFHTNTANVLAFVSAGMTEADLTIESASDCLTWIVQVFDFSVEKLVVGGEFLEVDTTSLVIAGLQTSAIWMLPVLAGAVGVSAYYIKTRMNKD